MVLIYIFLIANDIKHVSMGLLAIYTSYSVKRLKSFAYFLIYYFGLLLYNFEIVFKLLKIF